MILRRLPRERTPDATATEVLPGVWRVRHSWGNTWVLTDGREAALVDSGSAHDLGIIQRGLAAIGADLRIGLVLLTHGHCDHAGNADWFAVHHGASLAAHRDEVRFVETPEPYCTRDRPVFAPKSVMFRLGEHIYPVQRHVVDRVLDDGELMNTPIGPLRAIHTPGHTPGHVAFLHVEHGWLFSGDAIINIVPFRMRIGLSLPPAIFSTWPGRVQECAARLCALRPAALLAGHGPPLIDDAPGALAAFAGRIGVRRPRFL